MAKRKRMCRHCGRRMVMEYENHEACTNEKCDYTYSYDFDIPEGETMPPIEEIRAARLGRGK